MFQFFTRHNIGQPLSSRTLLKTPKDIKISQVLNVDYYNFGVENQIIQNLTTNYDDFINDQIYLTLNIDGIPFYKDNKESCWPILLCCNIESVTVFPIAITHGMDCTKPANTLFLRETVQELKFLQRNGLIFHGQRISIIIHCKVCDAPARSMVNCVKGQSGYFSCDRCTQQG